MDVEPFHSCASPVPAAEPRAGNASASFRCDATRQTRASLCAQTEHILKRDNGEIGN